MSNKAVKNSIYVAISLLEYDPEITTTIWSCLANSSKTHDVTIGVAYVSTDEAWKTFTTDRQDLFTAPNVKIRHFPILQYYGIGKGRNAAYEMYAAENFVLQVDAHTYFSQDWDVSLINKYHDGQKISNNRRTVITGVPEPYWYSPEKSHELVFDENDVPGYAYWLFGWWWVKDAVPRWSHRDPRKVTPNLTRLVEETGFAPGIKVCGAFMFAEAEIIDFIKLNGNFMFWEEEIVQSIDLIDAGYTIMYPFMPSPVRHFYSDDQTDETGRRAFIDDVTAKIGAVGNVFDNMAKNMSDYFTANQNLDKIKTYEEYAGIYLGAAERKRYFIFNDSVRRNQYKYSNIGRFPIE